VPLQLNQEIVQELGRLAVIRLETTFKAGAVKSTTFILLSATLGVGMLSVPKAFYESGIILSGALVYVAATISYLSMICLIRVSSVTKLTTYSELATWSYGLNFKRFTDFVFFVNNFGTAVTYTIVAKENFASAFESLKDLFWADMPHFLWDQGNVFWIIVCQGLLIPLIIKEKLTELRLFSILSFSIILYISLMIVVNCFTDTYTRNIDQKLDDLIYARFTGIPASLPIFIFGFTCQQNVLSCYRELYDPTLRRMTKVITRQIFFSSSIYIMVGVFGYLTFGNNFPDDESNILTRYAQKNISILIVNLPNLGHNSTDI